MRAHRQTGRSSVICFLTNQMAAERAVLAVGLAAAKSLELGSDALFYLSHQQRTLFLDVSLKVRVDFCRAACATDLGDDA